MRRKNVVFYNTKVKKKRRGIQKEVFVLYDVEHIISCYQKMAS